LEYALNAHSITMSRYDFTVDDERYEIIAETEKHRISSIQIGHILRDDVVFENGLPKTALDKLVASIELEDFQHAMTFFMETDGLVIPETNVDPDMIREIQRIIVDIEHQFERNAELPFELDDDAATREKQQWRYGDASPDVDHDNGMYTDDDQPPTL
jgi:hypothetical protein